MKKVEEVIKGTEGKPISLDYRIPAKINGPVVLYAHGFNGFKDWGGTDLIADEFAKSGLPFVKFNFSHNGTTPEHLTTFKDEEAYSTNTIGKELNDIFIVLNWINKTLAEKMGSKKPIVLIGHSRGAALSILVTARNRVPIEKLITWGAPAYADIPWHGWPKEKIFTWTRQGYTTIKNKRTEATMKLGLDLLEDFENHKANYDVVKAAHALKTPWLICHGADDETVAVENAHKLAEENDESELLIIKATGHTFGRKHPWKSKTLPEESQELVKKCISFTKK